MTTRSELQIRLRIGGDPTERLGSRHVDEDGSARMIAVPAQQARADVPAALEVAETRWWWTAPAIVLTGSAGP